VKPGESLYEIAKAYVAVIEAMERTVDKACLARLEEDRVVWHNRFMDKLTKEGIRFKDRQHVTDIAFRIARQEL
jgi:hypothetical protein